MNRLVAQIAKNEHRQCSYFKHQPFYRAFGATNFYLRAVVNARIRGYRTRQPYVAAHDAVRAYYRSAAQNGSIGVNHYVIFERRVALLLRQRFLDVDGAERHALIQ